MTTENVAILFTDIVGSTELSQRLSQEAADEVRRNHFTILRRAVTEADGTEVKNLGDGLMVVFGPTSAALACAVAMQQGVELNNRGQEHRVGLRVGLSVGEVSRDDDDYFGDPVVEAARLCARCESGQILATDVVRAMAGRRSRHHYRPVGELTLKGLPDPIVTVDVLWEPLATEVANWAPPPALVQRGGFSFAGRAQERVVLDGVWNETRQGACRLVLLAGEPGIGKTRLASEFAGDAVGNGGRVLAGRCDELVGQPYQPFAEALRFHLSLPDGASLLGGMPEELTKLVPEVGNVVSDLRPPLTSTPDAERIRLFDSVRSWLTGVAAAAPVFLVLDDIHWADGGSLLLLRHLVATDPIPGLCVVATYRDTDLARTHPLAAMLSDFHRRADTVRISLKGLDESGVAEFVTLASGQALDDNSRRLVAALSEETGGNPFFAGEVLRHLVETGAIEHRDGRWVAGRLTEGDLPEGVREVVGRRLSVLPEPTQQILSVASVVGAQFSLSLLAAVAATGEDEVLDDLEPAITAQLVSETGFGRYQFAHALIRSTLHHELTTTRRARLHRSVAEALVAIHGDDLDAITTDLAYHFGEAGAAAASDEALHFARRAAALAVERLAPDEAIRWNRAALDLLDPKDAETRAEVSGALAVAEQLAGTDSWITTQLGAAREALDLGDLALATQVLSIPCRLVTTVGGEPPVPDRISLLEETLDRTPEAETTQRAILAGCLGTEVLYVGDLVRRDQLFDETVRVVREVPNSEDRIKVLGYMFTAASTTNNRQELREKHALVDEARRLAEGGGDLYAQILAWVMHFFQELELGDGPAARASAARSAELLEVYPHPLAQDTQLMVDLMLAMLDGRMADAQERAAEIGRTMSAHGRIDAAQTYTSLGLLGVARETLGPDALVDAYMNQARERGTTGVYGALACSALAGVGRSEEAWELLEQHLPSGFAKVVDDRSWAIAISSWADAATTSGYADACRSLYEVLSDHDGLHFVTGCFYGGAVAFCRARLAAVLGLDDSVPLFEMALAEHERMVSPSWIARTHLEWGEHLTDRGDLAQARVHAGLALDVIGDLELTVSRKRAVGLLDRD